MMHLPVAFWVAFLVLGGSGMLAWHRISGQMGLWEPLIQGFLLMQGGLMAALPSLPSLLARPEVAFGILFAPAQFASLLIALLLDWSVASLLLGACWGWLIVLLADLLATWRGWPPHRLSPLVRAIQELRGLEVPEAAIERLVRRQFLLPRTRVRAILETGRGA